MQYRGREFPKPPPQVHQQGWRTLFRNFVKSGFPWDVAYWNVTDWQVDARYLLGPEPGERVMKRNFTAEEIAEQDENIARMLKRAMTFPKNGNYW